MNNGRCTVCPQRCSHDRHFYDRLTIKSVERTIKFALTASDQPQRFQSIEEFENVIENSFEEIIKEIEGKTRRLKGKSKLFNVCKDLSNFIHLLENRMRTSRSSLVARRTRLLLERTKNLAEDETSTAKKKAKIRTRRATTPVEPIETNLSECSTEHLIALIRQSNERIRLVNEELIERCSGNSVGYLSPSQLAKLCEFYSSYRLLPPTDLQQVFAQFHNEIQEKTEGKPAEILSVPMDTFLRYLAVQFCLKSFN